MNKMKSIIIDPIGVEDGRLQEASHDRICFGLLDLSIFNKICEFLRNSNVGFGSLRSFLDCQLKSCVNEDDRYEILAGGVGLLCLFIQKNWVGPDSAIPDKILEIRKLDLRENILKQLVVDGENVVSVVEAPELLLIAKLILEGVLCNLETCKASKIWYLRSLFIHQQILEELSPELFSKIGNIINELENEFNCLPKNKAALYHLEFARIFMYYQNIQKSKLEINKATAISGLEISLSGALGRRTKFQKADIAQLIIKIDLKNGDKLNESENKVPDIIEPKDIKLNDEVRLDKIKYTDAGFNKYPNLTTLQQAVLLGNLFQTQKSQPKDCLADEELHPLIDCILDQSEVWSIRMTTLLLRSQLEANHKRSVERSMMQLQALSDSLKGSETSFKQRFLYFFLSYLPPKWDVQSTLAKILTSMGSIKSALEIYEGLQDWENVIYCYNILQLRHKAQEIIEQEIKKDPSPKLWCLLGDATDDVTCYEKAWELSNHRSARAQRHWAYFYYYRKKYAESIDHFQKSLEINSLQKELWYRLGYAALAEENWEISAQAYRRYCVLDPECFEAWNNLARCYCELNQKYRAWRALQEALKVDYSNWKVWDNYMLVSSDLKAFDEVIKSYHEILNLKEKHLDLPVLSSLVGGFKNLENDNPEKIDRNKFRMKLLELFGRLTSQIIKDGDLWFLYSEVIDADTPENITKKHQLLMKAHRSAINKPNWDQELENCNRVVYVLSKAVEVGLLSGNPNILLSCKMAATGAIAKIKKNYPDAGISEQLEKNLEKLVQMLDSQN